MERSICRPVERRLNGGYSIKIKAPSSEIFRTLIDPKKASKLALPGRWEIPLQEGRYVTGSRKRSFRRILGFTWISDWELEVLVGDSKLVWRSPRPAIVKREIWEISRESDKECQVALVFKPPNLQGPVGFIWRRFASKLCSRTAERTLKSLKRAVESRSGAPLSRR